MEKLLHTEDPSLKKESGKHKKNEIERLKNLILIYNWSKREGLNPLFFIEKYIKLKYISFDASLILKENYLPQKKERGVQKKFYG